METVELPGAVHPFYFAAQYHPEFKSWPAHPSPPFAGFVRAAAGKFRREDSQGGQQVRHGTRGVSRSVDRTRSTCSCFAIHVAQAEAPGTLA